MAGDEGGKYQTTAAAAGDKTRTVCVMFVIRGLVVVGGGARNLSELFLFVQYTKGAFTDCNIYGKTRGGGGSARIIKIIVNYRALRTHKNKNI